jgi:hypothetical protein
LSVFGRGFRSNNRKNYSEEGLLFLEIKIEDSSGIFIFLLFEDFSILFLLEFNNSIYGRELRGKLRIKLIRLSLSRVKIIL